MELSQRARGIVIGLAMSAVMALLNIVSPAVFKATTLWYHSPPAEASSLAKTLGTAIDGDSENWRSPGSGQLEGDTITVLLSPTNGTRVFVANKSCDRLLTPDERAYLTKRATARLETIRLRDAGHLESQLSSRLSGFRSDPLPNSVTKADHYFDAKEVIAAIGGK